MVAGMGGVEEGGREEGGAGVGGTEEGVVAAEGNCTPWGLPCD